MIDSKWLATLESGVREGFSEEVTCKLRPKVQGRASHLKILERDYSRLRDEVV